MGQLRSGRDIRLPALAAESLPLPRKSGISVTTEPTPSKSTQPWLWIVVGLLAVAAIIAVVALVSNSGDDTAAPGDTTTTTVAGDTTTTTEAGSAASETVAKLQSGLTALGYYTGTVDGLYGAETTAAVKALQEDLGVPADGMYGPQTHEALAEALGGDPASEIIVALQTELKELGFYEGEIDGVYGPATVDAVKKLQSECGLTQDGIYGPATHQCLVDLGGNA
jgi:peptidoglycan hydrolase-like protein with peptidoglycan-binding domain